jgi:hypothetical protein
VPGADAVDEPVEQLIGDGAALHAGALQEWAHQQGVSVLRVRRGGQFALGGGQGEGGAYPVGGRGGEPVAHLGRQAVGGALHHGQRDAGDRGQRHLIGQNAQFPAQPRADRGDRLAEERNVHQGHRVEHELLGPGPVPVDRGPPYPGLPGHALVGDRGRAFPQQQVAGRVQHRLAAAGQSGINGSLHCANSRWAIYETA